MLDGCYFDAAAGERVVSFFDRFLVHSMGEWAGRPFTLLDWQRDDVVMPLFGWRRKDGKRRYRKADIFVAKKNGKTSLAGGLALYFLIADGEPRAEVYSAAFTREQAGIAYRESAALARMSPALAARFKIIDSRKRILCPENASFFQVLAGEAGGAEGINWHAFIFDEIHVQRDDRLWKSIIYGKSARAQPMLLNVSTVGVADRTSIWWARYEYAQGILEGSIRDASSFAYVAQADATCATDLDRAGDEREWKKANPSLGVTVQLDQFREDYLEARNSPVMFNAFLRYRLNVPTVQEERLIRLDQWDACGDHEVPPLDGRPCYGGLDVADTDDITALVLFFPSGKEGEPDYCLARFWCPRWKIEERVKAGLGFYGDWVRDGLIEATDTRTTDHSQVVDAVADAAAMFELRELAFDGWNAGDIAEDCIRHGVTVVKVPQTFSGLALGTKRLLDKVTEGSLGHGNNPVLRWMAGNAAGVTDHNENVRPAKDKSKDKIDGIAALVMAIGRAAVANKVPSIYEERGLATV